MMRLHEVIWKDRFVDKIEAKHGVSTDEVEEILFGKPHVRRAQKGHIKGEDLYTAYGQTTGGRHLIIFFVRKELGGSIADFSPRHDRPGAKIL